MKKDGDAHEEGHENGNGEGLFTAEEGSYIDPSDTEDHDHESECEHENFGNGSLEASYVEESSGVVDEAGAHDHEGTSSFSVDQNYVEEPAPLLQTRSPEPGEPTSNLRAGDDSTSEPTHEGNGSATEDAKQDDIADIVGLLESTSFTSKHILQGSDEGVANDSPVSSSEKERLRIGEIPDEE